MNTIRSPYAQPIAPPQAAPLPPCAAPAAADRFTPSTEEHGGMKRLAALALTAATLFCGGAAPDAVAAPVERAPVAQVADAGQVATPTLRFRADGTFKILQLTDIHFQPEAGPEYAARYDKLIDGLLEAEKPDLVVITGDVLYWSGRPMAEYFDGAVSPMIRHQVPWAFAMGNHDAESTFTGNDILAYLQSKPYSVCQPGPIALGGSGNYAVEVHGAGGRTESVLYMLDSHDRPEHAPGTEPQGYAWLTPDQVSWYGQTSEAFTRQESGHPLPSLMFFHIPLPEYTAAWNHKATGSRLEPESPQGRNTGMFSAIEAHHDVMGVFAGHDHVNDYVGSLHGVALGYGRKTGLSVYGPAPLEHGGRVIVLHENKKSFDTWIRTKSGQVENKMTVPDQFDKAPND